MTVHNERLLAVARQVLLDDPAASFVQIASVAGVSRTTLHARFSSRDALLEALAIDAIEQAEAAYHEARLDEGTCREAVGRFVEFSLPFGPTADLLLRERSLDANPIVNSRYEQLDLPVIALIQRGQKSGELRDDLPPSWVASVLNATIAAAWERVASGDLAPNDAPKYVTAIVLDGAVPR